MNQLVEILIYFYLYICLALILFNIGVILHNRFEAQHTRKLRDRWRRELSALAPLLENDQPLPPQHLHRLRTRLDHDEELLAYQAVLCQEAPPLAGPVLKRYIHACAPLCEELARKYLHRDPMKRALFAYTMARLCNNTMPNRHALAELLLAYLDHSTIYCREQVLNALYTLGSDSALEQAFTLFTQQHWYHNAKLIADGLIHYQGDKTALVLHLWQYRTVWLDSLLVGIVQFASELSDAFTVPFSEALLQESLPQEVDLALMRYFRKHPDPDILPYLYQALAREGKDESDEYAIVSATVLCAYPGKQTRIALEQALHDHNWYVRKNAAASLVSLGIPEKEIQEVLSSKDRYACEILQYALQHEEQP